MRFNMLCIILSCYDIPKILETPFVGLDAKTKQAPYKFEIEMLRSKSFKPEEINALRI